MSATSDPSEAGEYLRRTALRDFTAFGERADTSSLRTLTLGVQAHDAPVTRLLKYALELVGLRAGGPGEKVEWWVDFSYEGESCELSHEKLGLLHDQVTPDDGRGLEGTRTFVTGGERRNARRRQACGNGRLTGVLL